jgi:hypothetical protein
MKPAMGQEPNRCVLVDAYEALRPVATSRASLGRGILVERGVAAWVHAWRTPGSSPASPESAPSPSARFPWTPGSGDEATHILVNMALTHLRWTAPRP